MAEYSFTIPQDAISAGVPAVATEVVADRGLNKKVRHRLLTAQFGDGYSQRARDGLNWKDQNLDFAMKTRPKAEVSLVEAYLDQQAGKSIDFVLTTVSGTETIKVVCEEYDVVYFNEDYHTLTAKFKKVNEP